MPDAQVRVLADGGAEVCVRVDEPLGLMPWLLGWGAACRVQAPAVLRERMAQEVRTLALRYGWFISQVPGAPAVVEEDVENG
jgi:predicted DNA-binding transcriptional regulator YafY